MSKTPITIRVSGEEELKELAESVLHVLVNLAHAEKEYSIYFGSNLKRNRDYWRGRADLLIEKYLAGRVSERHQAEIKINS